MALEHKTQSVVGTHANLLHRSAARESRRAAATLAPLASLVLAALLAACSSSGSGGPATTSALTASDVANASSTIGVAGWQFYELEDAQDAGSVDASWSYLNTDKDVVTKARTDEFDVVNASGANVKLLDQLDLLQPINTDLLTNYDKLDPTLRDDPLWRNADGQVVAVPFALSPTFTAYDSARVPEPMSLDDLLKPEYRGGIGLFDDPTTIEQIATGQGVADTSAMTQAELDRAVAYLDQLRPNVKTFYGFGEDVQLFNRGDISVALPTFGSVLAKAIQNNSSIKFKFLAENTYVDAWVIVRSDNEAAALNWIDRTLSEEGQAAIVGASGSYPANPQAVPALAALGDPVSVATAALSLKEIFQGAPPAHGFSANGEGDVVSVDDVTRAWNDYKASF